MDEIIAWLGNRMDETRIRMTANEDDCAWIADHERCQVFRNARDHMAALDGTDYHTIRHLLEWSRDGARRAEESISRLLKSGIQSHSPALECADARMRAYRRIEDRCEETERKEPH